MIEKLRSSGLSVSDAEIHSAFDDELSELEKRVINLMYRADDSASDNAVAAELEEIGLVKAQRAEFCAICTLEAWLIPVQNVHQILVEGHRWD